MPLLEGKLDTTNEGSAQDGLVVGYIDPRLRPRKMAEEFVVKPAKIDAGGAVSDLLHGFGTPEKKDGVRPHHTPRDYTMETHVDFAPKVAGAAGALGESRKKLARGLEAGSYVHGYGTNRMRDFPSMVAPRDTLEYQAGPLVASNANEQKVGDGSFIYRDGSTYLSQVVSRATVEGAVGGHGHDNFAGQAQVSENAKQASTLARCITPSRQRSIMRAPRRSVMARRASGPSPMRTVRTVQTAFAALRCWCPKSPGGGDRTWYADKGWRHQGSGDADAALNEERHGYINANRRQSFVGMTLEVADDIEERGLKGNTPGPSDINLSRHFGAAVLGDVNAALRKGDRVA